MIMNTIGFIWWLAIYNHYYFFNYSGFSMPSLFSRIWTWASRVSIMKSIEIIYFSAKSATLHLRDVYLLMWSAEPIRYWFMMASIWWWGTFLIFFRSIYSSIFYLYTSVQEIFSRFLNDCWKKNYAIMLLSGYSSFLWYIISLFWVVWVEKLSLVFGFFYWI